MNTKFCQKQTNFNFLNFDYFLQKWSGNLNSYSQAHIWDVPWNYKDSSKDHIHPGPGALSLTVFISHTTYWSDRLDNFPFSLWNKIIKLNPHLCFPGFVPKQLYLSRANQEGIFFFLRLVYPKKCLISIRKEIHPEFHHPRASNLSAETQEKPLGNPRYSLTRTLFSKHEIIPPPKHSQNIKPRLMGRIKFPCLCCPNTILFMMFSSQCVHNPDVRIWCHKHFYPKNKLFHNWSPGTGICKGAEPVSVRPKPEQPLAVPGEDPGGASFSTKLRWDMKERFTCSGGFTKTYLPQKLLLSHKTPSSSHPHSPMTQKSWKEPSCKFIGEGSWGLAGPGRLPWAFQRASLGAPGVSPTADTGNPRQTLAGLWGSLWSSGASRMRGSYATGQGEVHSACQAQASPLLVSPTVLEGAHPPAASNAANEGEYFQLPPAPCPMALLRMILELQRSKFLKGHSTQEARLTDITQNEPLHLCLLLVLLLPLLWVSGPANGSTWAPWNPDSQDYHGHGDRAAQGECLLLPHKLAPSPGAERLPSLNVYVLVGRRGNTRKGKEGDVAKTNKKTKMSRGKKISTLPYPQ